MFAVFRSDDEGVRSHYTGDGRTEALSALLIL